MKGVTDEYQKQAPTLQRYHNYHQSSTEKKKMSHMQRAGKSRQDVKTDGQSEQKHRNSRNKKNAADKNPDFVDLIELRESWSFRIC